MPRADYSGGTMKGGCLVAAFSLHTLTGAHTLTPGSPYIPAASWDQKDEIYSLWAISPQFELF